MGLEGAQDAGVVCNDHDNIHVKEPVSEVGNMSFAQTMSLSGQGLPVEMTLASYAYKSHIIPEMFTRGAHQVKQFRDYNEGIMDVIKYDAAKNKHVLHLTGK
jgi:hypothetical protein